VKSSSQSILTLFFSCTAAWALFESRDWPLATRLFPWLVAVSVVVLSLIQLVLDLTGRAELGSMTMDFQSSEEFHRVEGRARVMNVLCWILCYAIGIWLLGFRIALLLMLFGYLKFQSGETWKLSLLLTGGGYILFWGIFDSILYLTFPESLVWLWIEKLLG